MVTLKSINPLPLIVFTADALTDSPVAPPKLIDALTKNAFAEVTGFDNAMWMIKYIPAM